MKKFTSTLLALAVCAGVMAGCAGAPADSTSGAAGSASTAASSSSSSSAAGEKEPGLYVDGQKLDADPMMTINGREVSFDEYRYHFLTMLNLFGGRDNEFAKGDEAEQFESDLKNTTEESILSFYAFEELAKEKNISLTAAEKQEVDDAIAAIQEQLGGEEAYQQALAQQYYTADVYHNLYLSSKLDEKVIKEVYGDEIRSDIEKNYVHAQHILIPFATESAGGSESGSASASAAEPDHAAELAKAEEVLAKIEAGEDFEALISEYGEDPGQPAQGYYFTTGQMVQEFEDAAFALQEGAVSGIVETSYGYHIIKRLPLESDYVDANLTNMIGEEAAQKINNDLGALMEQMDIVYADNYDQVTSQTMY